MSEAAQDWMPRARQTLAVLGANPALWASIKAEVDAFLDAHPDIPRDQATHDQLTVIVFRRLTAGPEQTPTAHVA